MAQIIQKRYKLIMTKQLRYAHLADFHGMVMLKTW